MNYRNITERYYSCWLGKEGSAERTSPGISCFYSPERNTAQVGYGQPFDLLLFRRGQCITLSYADRAADRLALLREKLRADMSAEELIRLLSETYQRSPQHSIKYLFAGEAQPAPQARPLCETDYPAYLDFFRACHPGCPDPSDWLPEYFQEMTARRLCCGVMKNGLLLSCTDAPSMPYLQQEAQEIGIQTRSEYRRCGLAMQACRQAIHEMVQQKLCPLWSAPAGNRASQRLAERLGFVPLADCLALSL